MLGVVGVLGATGVDGVLLPAVTALVVEADPLESELQAARKARTPAEASAGSHFMPRV